MQAVRTPIESIAAAATATADFVGHTQPAQMGDYVESVHAFNRDGSTVAPPTVEYFNADRVTFYIGMMCEELSETLKAIANGEVSLDARNKMNDRAFQLERLGEEFKAGQHMGAVLRADRVLLLDGCADVNVVSLGATMYQTPHWHEALIHVANKNMDKAVNGVFQRDPTTGKILKREGWTPPNLQPYIVRPND